MIFDFFFVNFQSAHSIQSLHSINFENYGYSMGSPFQDLMSTQRSTPSHIGDQGLSPPYSNQSPPHSVQSIALSPQGYIGMLIKTKILEF